MNPPAHRPQAAVITGLLASALALLGLLLVPSTGSAATNLVTNAGFESGSLSGWSCPAGVATTSSPHSGSYALQASPSSSDIAQCTQSIAVQPNTAYTLSAWVKGSNVYLGVDGGASTWTTSSMWSQLTVPFTRSASATSVTIYLHGWYALPPYQADDVVLDGPGGTADTTPPSTPSGPTDPPPASDLPTHIVTGYWQNFNNGATVQRISDVQSAYDLIAVAFADADPSRPGGITFNLDSAGLGGYTVAQFKADIAAKHAAGTAQACIMLQGGLRPDQVGLGLPASSRAAGSGYVPPTIVNNALDCLTKGTNCGNFKPSTTWPSLRGAMTWSTNWDALNGSAFANQVGAHVHSLP